jgi:Ca2+-binding RTX toxin-like protein
MFPLTWTAGVLAASDGVTAPAIVGSLGNDTLSGGAGNDVIKGLAGDDSLAGLGGNDRLIGGSGDDTLTGGAGNDRLEGGDGIDTASYFDSTSGVQVDLNLAGRQETGWGNDTLSGIERIIGSQFADRITGDNGDNVISSNGGGDTILAGGGDDLIGTLDGDATVDGGAGADTIQIFNDDFGDRRGLHIDLTLQGSVQDTGRGMMLLTGIENVTSTFISTDDILTGDRAGNILAAAAGNDILSGGGGADRLLGDGFISISGDTDLVTVYESFVSPGDDTLIGGAGDDTLVGGGGSNLLTGGAGKDVFKICPAAAGDFDTVTDLTGKDFVDLTNVDAGFAFNIVKSFTGAGHEMTITYDKVGHVTVVLGDLDGDTVPDFELHIDGKMTSFDNFIF